MLGFNNCGMNVPVVADIGGGCGCGKNGFGGNALEDIIALVVVAAIFGFGGRGFGFGGGFSCCVRKNCGAVRSGSNGGGCHPHRRKESEQEAAS